MPTPKPKPKPKAPKQRVHRRPNGTLTVARVIAALNASAGIRATAAEKLLVHRSAVTKFIQAHPEIALVEAEIIEDLADMTESKLHEGIRRGEFPFIKLFLESKARNRGYGRNVAITGANGGPVEIRDLSNLTDEQLEALERAAAALASGTGGAES